MVGAGWQAFGHFSQGTGVRVICCLGGGGRGEHFARSGTGRNALVTDMQFLVNTALANLDVIGAWALTEPFNGSDAAGLQTTAKKVPGRCELVNKSEGDYCGWTEFLLL